jgi:hypothetical protein
MTSAQLMLLSRAVFLSTVAAIAIACSSPKPKPTQDRSAPADARIRVGPNVHVSGELAELGHYEIVIAADPNNAAHLLICGDYDTSDPIGHYAVSYTSVDTGRTWKKSFDAKWTNFVGDPACAYGPDGSAIFASLPLHYEANVPHEMKVIRSSDAGRTWSEPVTLMGVDREFVAVDMTNGPNRGNIYLDAADVIHDEKRRDAVLLFRSRDGGKTFDKPLSASLPTGRGLGGMSPIVVLSDGTIAFISNERHTAPRGPQEPYRMDNMLYTSTDGGATLNPPIRVVTKDYCAATEMLVPSLAADASNGPFRDRLYFLYQEARSGRCNIMITFSSDRGKTWSAPHVVNDDYVYTQDAKSPNHSMPAVFVNKAGVVGVTWYDSRETGPLGYMPRFSASLDGGVTFLPSVELSEKAFMHREDEPLSVGGFASGGGFIRDTRRGGSFNAYIQAFYIMGMGHTGGLTADARGVFHTIWVDNRTGIPQIWTAPVTVAGTAHKNGAAELDSLVDVTDQLMLTFISNSYDPKTHQVTVDATLRNTSKASVRGPVALRVTRLGSAFGAPSVTNATNRERGPGAIWSFDQALSPDGLAPGATSKPVRLVFGLSGFKLPETGESQLINLEARAYGRSDAAPAKRVDASPGKQ